MNNLNTQPITLDDIKLWQESTPGDHGDWDPETITDCDGFLRVVLERLEEARDAFKAYYRSEGCSCCRDLGPHTLAADRIGAALGFSRYDDDSGYNFYENKDDG